MHEHCFFFSLSFSLNCLPKKTQIPVWTLISTGAVWQSTNHTHLWSINSSKHRNRDSIFENKISYFQTETKCTVIKITKKVDARHKLFTQTHTTKTVLHVKVQKEIQHTRNVSCVLQKLRYFPQGLYSCTERRKDYLFFFFLPSFLGPLSDSHWQRFGIS